MQSFHVAVNGVRLNVTDWGGDGSPVLLAHPTGFLGAVWRPVIDCMRTAGFAGRVLTFDQRGHGLSSKPDQGYEWSNFVEDACELIVALDLRDFLGVGHSAGATTLACASARKPGRARGLILIDPILIDRAMSEFRRGRDNPMAAKTRTRRLVWSSRSELYRSFRQRPPYDTWTDDALRAYVEEGSFERPDGEYELFCPGRIEAQIYQNADTIDGFACLGALRIPTVIVRGEQTDSFDESRAKRALSCLHSGRLLTIQKATHYVPMEQPRLIADLILAERNARGYTEAP
jgi:pimeloyl-ACP methyl ester carboxylesterase